MILNCAHFTRRVRHSEVGRGLRPAHDHRPRLRLRVEPMPRFGSIGHLGQVEDHALLRERPFAKRSSQTRRPLRLCVHRRARPAKPWVGLDLASTPGADVAISGNWKLNLSGLAHDSAAQRRSRRGRKVQPYIGFQLSLNHLTRRPISTVRQKIVAPLTSSRCLCVGAP
jgi:hypothetical protein